MPGAISRVSPIVLVLLGFLTGCDPAEPKDPEILGVWQVRESRTVTGADTASVADAQPSLTIFADGYYSHLWIPGHTAMRSFATRWTPTDEEKILRYGEIIVNAGEYTTSDSTLTTHPIISRVPEFMGGTLVYRFRVVGDTLWLTTIDELSFDGIRAPWAESGTRTTLVMERIGTLQEER